MATAIVKRQHQCDEIAERWNEICGENTAIVYHTKMNDSLRKETMKNRGQ